MKLIIGLGNPGRAYANNRHNIGFMCLSHFAKARGIPFDRKQGQARVGSREVAGVPVVVARPQTYMNQSGRAVSLLVNRHHVALADLIVIHDDLDLPLGKLRIRFDGSSAGHKGISSIVAALGSPDFVRVRIGIGRPADAEDRGEEVIDFVLGDFTPEERAIVADVIPRVNEALLCLLTEGLSAAMNTYN